MRVHATSSATLQAAAGRTAEANTHSAAPGTPGRLRELYRGTIVRQGHADGFLMALCFVLTSFVIRGITHAVRDHRLSFIFHNVASSGGTHVHHMVFGILGLLIVGFVEVGFRPERTAVRRLLAIAFGVAAALTLDEFALWLRFQDVYWSSQGRESVYALIAGGGLSLLAVEGLGFWRALWRDTVWLVAHRQEPYPTID
jgi:hypothetical protein